MIRRGVRPANRSLRRYIHTQGFTRLSGNRRVEAPAEGISARLALILLFFLVCGTGLWFVMF